MAKQFLTLLDIHAMNKTVGPLIEEVIHEAPVVGRTPVKRIEGTRFDQLVRKSLPRGGFTNPGDGVLVSAGGYDSVAFDCKHMEAQLEAKESFIKKKIRQEGGGIGDVLAMEAEGYIKQQLIDLDVQYFDGTKNAIVNGASNGFAGLVDLVDPSMVFTAGGATANKQTSAWFVFESEDYGVSFLMPNGEELNLSPWQYQSLLISGDRENGALTKTMGYSCGLTGYIGLKATTPKRCIARVANIESGNALSDKLAAFVNAMFLRGYKPTVCYMSDMSGFHTAASRENVVVSGKMSINSASESFRSMPTEVAGIPIVFTDSISDTEAVVAGGIAMP